jgi:hypothetical protein
MAERALVEPWKIQRSREVPGRGRCFALAPDLFDLDDFGMSVP